MVLSQTRQEQRSSRVAETSDQSGADRGNKLSGFDQDFGRTEFAATSVGSSKTHYRNISKFGECLRVARISRSWNVAVHRRDSVVQICVADRPVTSR